MAYNIYKYINSDFSSGYVFYNRLVEDGHEDIYNTAINKTDYIKNISAVNELEDSEILMTMARAELSKEQAILRQQFKCNFSEKNIEDDGFYNELIKLLNYSLNIKDVFERNVLLTQNTRGQKAVFNFFGEYFQKSWEKNWHLIRDEIKTNTNNFKKYKNLDNIVFAAYDKYIGDIMLDAFKMMFIEAKVENGLQSNAEFEKYQKAYEELYTAINSGGNQISSNQLLKEFYDTYRLDEIRNGLKEMVTTGRTQKGRRKNANLSKQDLKNLSETATKMMAQRGGYSLEYFENVIISNILNELKTKDNISVYSEHTGNFGEMKADNIYTIGIDEQKMKKFFEEKFGYEEENSIRARNIEKIRELQTSLKDTNNGFIIYSSDKSYTINDNFSSRGGFGGNAQSLENFLHTMSLTNRNINKNLPLMFGAIVQSCKGAIGDKQNLQDFEDKIAQDLAFMLFDDFDTIGKEMQNVGVNSLHIMNLNGILLPLSFILFLMAKAVRNADKNIRSIVKVHISLPEILYSGTGELSWHFGNMEKAWENQRKYVKKEAEITTYFLKDFNKIISEYITIDKS